MKNYYRLIFAICIFLTSINISALAQNRNITGTITDAISGESLPGVNIVCAGTIEGTVSDINGNYSISVMEETLLIFSFVGFEQHEVRVGAQSVIDVGLSYTTEQLLEIVVVGFGEQKKINVSGSVVALNEANFKNRAVTNVSNILSGQTPGLTVLQRGGAPGRNQGQLKIRGIGTLGGPEKSDPLIIIDGIESASLTEINPSDIENVSILKDASASAIYGVRAANGVIIVTTKRGHEGKVSVNYISQFGFSEATSLPKKVNSWNLAELHTESEKNAGLSTRFFNQDDIDLFESGTSPYTHANSDQVGEIFNQNGQRQEHNLRISGGTSDVLFNISLGYVDEEGLMENTGLTRYTLRTNLDINITEKFSLGLNLASSQREIIDPIVGVGGIIHRAYREWATDPIRLENGNWANANYGTSQGIDHNSVALLRDGGQINYVDTKISTTLFADYALFDFLSIKGVLATTQDFNRNKKVAKSLSLYNMDGSLASTSPSGVFEQRDNFSDLNLQLLVNFNKQFGDHEVSALGGINTRKKESILTSFSAQNLSSNQLDQIDGANLTQDAVRGNTVDYRLNSYFGRINYGYKSKYLFEANLRYDGTSRFAATNRYQTFPSFSVAWRLSEESFFNIPFVEDLKFRSSWGKLGNQEIGDYRFMNTYGFGELAFIDNREQSGATERRPIGNEDIIWETTEVFNYGLDLSLLEGALTFSGDYFVRNTNDVLIQKPLAAIFGSGTSSYNFPFVNAASTRNKGFELDLHYRAVIGNWKISTGANFSKVSTEIVNLAGTDQPGFRVGDPIANIYGYEALGIFQTQDEVDNHFDQSSLGGKTEPGDIKYADISGPDGVPDQIINSFDRKNLGSYFPSINYGFSFQVDHKGIYLSMLLQGVSDVQAEIGGRQRQPFYLGSSPWEIHLNRSILDRDGMVTNPDADYPKTLLTANDRNYVTSSWWVQNTAFLKLRNVQLGYQLPSLLLDKLHLQNCAIYISGENLLVFTDFEGFDPEVPTTGGVLPLFSGNGGYPITRTYTIGLNITF